MFFLFQLLESIKLVKGVQTSSNHFLLLFVKRIPLLIETGNFSPGLLLGRLGPSCRYPSLLLGYLGPFFFLLEYFSLFLEGFPFENFGYSVDLANIAGLALTNTLGIPYILSVARSDVLSLILFTASTRGYVSFTSFGYRVTKGDRTTIVAFGWHNGKEGRSWPSSDISYVVLKRRGDASREGNNITKAHVTGGP
jgi:hypothetical protein